MRKACLGLAKEPRLQPGPAVGAPQALLPFNSLPDGALVAEVVEVAPQGDVDDGEMVEGLDEREQQKLHVAAGPVLPQHSLRAIVEEHQDEGHQDGEQVNHAQDVEERVPVDGAVKEQPHGIPEAHKLDEAGQKLEDKEVRQRDGANDTVLGTEEHLPMVDDDLKEAATPARTLVEEALGAHRTLGPAAGLRDLAHTERQIVVAHIGNHAQQHIHILRHGGAVVATGADGDLGVEQAEAARDVGQRVEARPAQLADEERAQILQLLEAGQDAPQHGQVDQTLVLVGDGHLTLHPVDVAVVAHQHRGADADHGLVAIDDQPHHTVEGHGVDDAVGIGADKIRGLAHIDAGIRAVGLASAVHLAHDGEVGEAFVFGLVNGNDACARHLVFDTERDFLQIELLPSLTMMTSKLG